MFRTVLVHVDNQSASRGRIQAAIDVARQFDASLIGMTAGIPKLPIEIYSASLGTVALGPEDDAFGQKHLEAEFSDSAKKFEDATRNSGLETSWQAVFDAPSLAITRAATAADIVVVGPGDHSLLGDLRSAAAGDIVLRTGRPVLVIPESVDSIKVARVMVAWKDTTEAQRALADAIPFMKRAAQVLLVQVQDKADQPSTDLAAATGFLLRHGIAAEPRAVQPDGNGVEYQLLDYANRNQIDLIVAGAYGHSRLREWVLGGVTRELLTQSHVPCLLSH
jgi:nucleotide-binding universal stress UspA family protein